MSGEPATVRHQRTQQALRVSELSYRRLFEAAQDGILILDVHTGRITDVNPFLGLIQSLIYSVELSTPSQRTRLQRAYPDRFAEISSGPGIDVYLILLRYPTDKVSQEFLTLTGQMSAFLMAKDCPVSNIVRRKCHKTSLILTRSGHITYRS